MVPETLKARIDQIYRDLDRYSYYQLLNLPADACGDEVRRAFHRMALSLHPDCYHAESDREIRRKVHVIYKRIAEGYRVLQDSERRAEYGEALTRGELRLIRKERDQPGKRAPEAAITNPQARKYFTMAREAERKGDRKSARMYYKFCTDLIGEHPMVQERVAALEGD